VESNKKVKKSQKPVYPACISACVKSRVYQDWVAFKGDTRELIYYGADKWQNEFLSMRLQLLSDPATESQIKPFTAFNLTTKVSSRFVLLKQESELEVIVPPRDRLSELSGMSSQEESSSHPSLPKRGRHSRGGSESPTQTSRRGHQSKKAKLDKPTSKDDDSVSDESETSEH